MKKSKPTLKDLAEKLGLSISTVSRALQDNPNINERTKISVKKLAKELGYYPHALAKSLKKKKTRTIGVIVPEISHFFFLLSSSKNSKAELASKQISTPISLRIAATPALKIG